MREDRHQQDFFGQSNALSEALVLVQTTHVRILQGVNCLFMKAVKHDFKKLDMSIVHNISRP